MEKREKIMLGVLAATLVVAGAMYFPGLSGAPGGVSIPGLTAGGMSMDEVAQTVEQSKLTKEQNYRLGLLTQPTPPNPFYGGQWTLSQDEGATPGGAGEPQYSGYIKVGQKIYAVINGVEYARGDELAEGGYVVQTIDRSFVVLERTDGSTGRKLTKRVPLMEDDTDKIRIRVVKKK